MTAGASVAAVAPVLSGDRLRMVRTVGPRVVLVRWHEIDMANAHLFGALLEDAITCAARDGEHRVVVDMTAVRFADSPALRALVDVTDRHAALAVELVLRGLGPAVARVLQAVSGANVIVVEGATGE